MKNIRNKMIWWLVYRIIQRTSLKKEEGTFTIHKVAKRGIEVYINTTNNTEKLNAPKYLKA